MRETAEDLQRLQGALDESRRRAGEHLRKAFGESAATAAEIARSLSGVFEMHLAVVSRSGAPRVAPVDGVLFHGRITFGLPAGSVRSRLVRADDRVSASYNHGSTAFIVHGLAHELADGDEAAEFEELTKQIYVGIYGPGWLEWFDAQQSESRGGFTGWIEPRRIYVKL